MIKPVALFVFCAAFLVGCAAPTKTIKFDSEPRGARVFQVVGANEDSANNSKGRNFLGVTPFDWTTEVNGDGTFQARSTAVPFYSDFVQSVVIFVAEPPSGATNLFVQREIFHTNASIQSGTPVPDGIFFQLDRTASVPMKQKGRP
jgi:hypothetical protein